MAVPVEAALLILSATSALFSLALTEPISQGGLSLNLSGRASDILVRRGAPLWAACDSGSPANVTIRWAGGPGTCANSTSSDEMAFTYASIYTRGHLSDLTIESTLYLPLALYHYVKCIATTASTTASLCRQFRVYEASNGKGFKIDNEKLRIGCGIGMIPTGVAVNIVWSLDSRPEPLRNQTWVAPNDGSAFYNVTPSDMILDAYTRLGGIYKCSVTSPQFGELFSNEVRLFGTPRAVITGLIEKNYSGNGVTRVTMRCEGFGYDTPSVRLRSPRDPSKIDAFAIEGGRATTAEFYSTDDEPLYLSSFSCQATNSIGTSTAYYKSNETEPTQTAINLASLSNGALLFRALAAVSLLSRLY